MGLGFLNRILKAGTSGVKAPLAQNIVLTNRISLALFVITILFSINYWLFLGVSFLFWFIIASAVAFLFPILLNLCNWYNLGRLILGALIPFLALGSSILFKLLDSDNLSAAGYYDYRFIMLISSILPFLYFHLTEWKWLALSLSFGLLTLLFFDTAHNAIGLGFFQVGLQSSSYGFSTIVTLFSYFANIACLVILRYTIEQYMSANNTLVDDLIQKNTEIERQNESIALREIKLNEALNLISDQKEIMRSLNIDLQRELMKKNKLLENTNDELIKYNSELRQFSYTISHNLRGPVATLLGLFDLFTKSQGDRGEILVRMKNSVVSLDEVITDLNKIISIRNEVFKIKEKVVFEDEVNKIKSLLHKEIEKFDIDIRTDFSKCQHLYSVKAIISSILYNLISNSIKYHSDLRKPVIKVKTYIKEGFTIIKVRDNGIGIDLGRFKDNVFQPYQRFNFQTSGKGLGLYIVKTQVESLDGEILVESKPGEWTEFLVKVRNIVRIHKQLFFDCEYAKIYYNAELKLNHVIWLRQPNFDEYKQVYLKAMEQMIQYKTPYWLVDYRKQGEIPLEYHKWTQEKIIPTLFQNDLKAAVGLFDEKPNESVLLYQKMTIEVFKSNGVKIFFTSSKHKGYEWLDKIQ